MQESLIKRLPEEVINNIIPYTYSLQPKELLLDIRSFSSDFQMVMDCYYIHYNERILLHDLHVYCTNNFISFNNADYLVIPNEYLIGNIFQASLFINNRLYNNHTSTEIRNKVRLIWGLLGPIHRTRFINKYILVDEIVL